MFDGEDALGWLVKIERYYSINEVEGNERMESLLSYAASTIGTR